MPTSFLLSAAHRDDGQVARAFAAELLAPAAGIRQFLDRLGKKVRFLAHGLDQRHAEVGEDNRQRKSRESATAPGIQ